MENVPGGEGEDNARPLTPDEVLDADRFGVLFAAVMTFGHWLEQSEATPCRT